MAVNQNNPNPNIKLVLGVILTVVCLVAYLFLKINKIDTGELIIFMAPLVTFLLIGSKVEAESQKQNEVLSKIDHQTNGVLEQKIRKITTEVVHNVLDERARQDDKLF